ncbi:MAG: aminopeptidase, partial [Candidatus Aenigmarchaeota archaeon]|nr:aminopeptidase [Candidatus Aenigmarchaeota archaeon]
MADERVRKAAEILVDHSTKVRPGDRVLISTELDGKELALECYRLCLERGA